jgi:TonB family protein
MSAVRPAIEFPPPAAFPRLLVELPSRPRVFFSNLRDFIFPRRLSPLELRSSPAEFWPDVFVKRGLPWYGFLRSSVYHVLASALMVVLTRFIALQPQVVSRPTFERSQVVYYPASEYLPPLDTRTDSSARPAKSDPQFSNQPIISVPPETDNRAQTVVTPPSIKLKQNIALPNMVAWSDSDEIKPRLAIPPAPLTPASDISRMAPKLENSVVTPPPNATDLTHRREMPALQASVVAPPPELRISNVPAAIQGLQPALIAPPPTVDRASTRPLRDMNIAPSAVIAPAPQLPVAEQRSAPGGRLSPVGGAMQVVPPPPSISGSGSSAGSRGRVIALNVHPAVGAPPEPPAGNRRGAFAATPEGRPGSSGLPGAASGGAGTGSGSRGDGKENGTGAGAKKDVPNGLYVGTAVAKTSGVAGDSASKSVTNSVDPNVVASVRSPRVTTAPRPMQPDNAANLSEPERAVFGNRKFYSVTLNMPNLNSAGGSWVIRFAELKHESTNQDPNAPAADLSQPFATRKVDPAYPVQLMRENVAGTVILYAVIHSDGRVGDVRILRGVDERLDRFAIDAVAKWKFDPATKNGAPVAVEATFQIPFRPARVGTNF